jgi:hypothetical protein
MDDTTKTILIAAGSGTIGAAITQICSLVNNYYSDRRKYQAEQNKVIILRKIEVGECAIHHIGLTIQMFRKLIHYFQNSAKFTSQNAFKAFNEFLDEQEEELKQSEIKNAIVNFIPIYFDVQTGFSESATRDSKTIKLEAESEDIVSKINSDPAKKRMYVERLIEIRKEFIEHYLTTIQILEADYATIIKDVQQLIRKIN